MRGKRKFSVEKARIDKKIFTRSRDGLLFMTIAELTASGHSRRPSGRSPCSALFVARSLGTSFIRTVSLYARVHHSIDFFPHPNVNHIRTPRATIPLSVPLFKHISILRAHHAICTILQLLV